MLYFIATALAISLLIPANDAAARSDDNLLRRVIQAYEVKAYKPSGRSLGPKERLGQALFFDPIVSGPQSISCATCHVRSLGAGDGLRLAVGLGAKGVSKERLASEQAFIVPRNALPFFNRGSEAFRAFFWDGRVQHGANGRFESPLGERLPKGFENLLAVASVFPPAEPDEMLGRSARRVGPEAYHAELVSPSVDSNNFQLRTLAVFESLRDRLLAPSEKSPNNTVTQYRALFQTAYPGVGVAEFRIHHIGNALSAYIAAAFELQAAPWDRYVSGDGTALAVEQKQGALIFFGKGRCAVCHSGTEFSDFRFHGLAIPQMRVGKHGRHLDYGRAAATSRGEDRFAFRTPPLRNVVDTPPWGHNGLFSSLVAVIEHHINPVPVLHTAQQQSPDEAAHAGRLLGFRSSILAEIAPLSINEIRLIIRFLDALSSPPLMPDSIAIPATVPSGNIQFVRR